MSKISRKVKEKHFKAIGDQHTFFSRITKTLYYGKLPNSDRLSLPVTELASELFSEAQNGRSLERLHCNEAATISRNACVSPCSFILAMLYLERLKTCNPDYLLRTSPSELFLVSLMVSSKFLYDDGEEDEVFIDEWASSGGVTIKQMILLEKDFLKAIDWEIFVNELSFWKKLKELERTIAKREGITRGWLTYTELESLLISIDLNGIMQYVAALTAILIATYTAGIVTIVSSMFLVSYLPGNCLQSTRTVGTQTNDTKWAVSGQNAGLSDVDDSEIILSDITDFKCDASHEMPIYKKQIDAVDVLKTSLILVSIKTVDINSDSNKSCYDSVNLNADDNKEVVSWDWWTSPTMEWLTRTSKMIQTFDFFIPEFRHYIYTDATVANSKTIDLQDQMHKATKIRIQDQLERSWHKEWTDTIKDGLFPNKPFNYLRNMKV